MARPREFDEEAALDAAVQCFWANGYEGASIRELAASMGIAGASLYNVKRLPIGTPYGRRTGTPLFHPRISGEARSPQRAQRVAAR
jgi:Bacterial regulatory proteins, tetR family